ncbi:TIGR00375 family protein [Paenibacillus sp. SYP-B3998]|uniref:TIGR00375 family protein n=1 Tax=Paenibacillus sp. SYP-B3998 TaxID=2678564 RepID=A0A6G3ZVK2_9BACL|nr:endonuclease Q family protein [Paenibacillus sp. SYP-B3998]NEW06162.1 TIGR00375 family protein [Paenibacillus sp. SYP-B3998]
MNSYYVDLHIHIGRTEKGSAVKISAANDLTFFNIAREASERKGIEVIGIIDCHSPTVQDEIMMYLDRGEMIEQAGGGIRYKETHILLGSEIEVRDPGMGAAHLLAYMPNLSTMQDFTRWMKGHMKNVELSSQRIYVPARTLQEEVLGRGGIVIPAHIFTPHKSIYGSSSTRMEHLLQLDGISAVELGLSADSDMAGLISELDRYTFVTNSDAHSLGKIGREYNQMQLAAPTYEEIVKALHRQDGRKVEANYGLNPRLGKYHRTYCGACESILDESETTVERCLYCGSKKIVRGVMDRILALADREEPYLPPYRPSYQFQVPLEFIPGLGPKKLNQLLLRFGTEMNVLHRSAREDLASIVGEDIAAYIVGAREGRLELEVGGGGRYGKVKNHS